jgi:hypothetical protein
MLLPQLPKQSSDVPTGSGHWVLGTEVSPDGGGLASLNSASASGVAESALRQLQEDVLSLKFAATNVEFVGDLHVSYASADLQVRGGGDEQGVGVRAPDVSFMPAMWMQPGSFVFHHGATCPSGQSLENTSIVGVSGRYRRRQGLSLRRHPNVIIITGPHPCLLPPTTSPLPQDIHNAIVELYKKSLTAAPGAAPAPLTAAFPGSPLFSPTATMSPRLPAPSGASSAPLSARSTAVALAAPSEPTSVTSSIAGGLWGTTSTTPARRTSSGVADALLFGQPHTTALPPVAPRGNTNTTAAAGTLDASMFVSGRLPTSALDDTSAQLAKLKQGLDSYSDLDQRIQALSQGLLDTVRGSQVGFSSCVVACRCHCCDIHTSHVFFGGLPSKWQPRVGGGCVDVQPAIHAGGPHAAAACSRNTQTSAACLYHLCCQQTPQEGVPAAASAQAAPAAAAGPDLDALIAEVKMCSEAALRASGDKAALPAGTALLSGDSMTPEQLQAALCQSQQLSGATPNSNSNLSLNTGESTVSAAGGQEEGSQQEAVPGAGTVVSQQAGESAAESAEAVALLQQQLEDLLSANEDLRQQLVAAERAAAEAADEEDVWVEERAALEQQVLELKAAAAAAAEESRQLVAGEVRQLLEDNAALQARLQALSADSAALEALRAEHEVLQRQFGELEASLAAYQSLQAAHTALLADHVALQANLAQLQAQLLALSQTQQGMAPSGQEEAWAGAHAPLASAGDDQEGGGGAAGGGVPDVVFSRGLPQEAAAAPSTAEQEDEVRRAAGGVSLCA